MAKKKKNVVKDKVGRKKFGQVMIGDITFKVVKETEKDDATDEVSHYWDLVVEMRDTTYQKMRLSLTDVSCDTMSELAELFFDAAQKMKENE